MGIELQPVAKIDRTSCAGIVRWCARDALNELNF